MKEKPKARDEKLEEEKQKENDKEEMQEEEEEKTPEATKEKQSKESADKKEDVTRSSERPSRERKKVERCSIPERGRSCASKPLPLPIKGGGIRLAKIPNVAFKLSRREANDKNLQLLHTVLFGRTVPYRKQNIDWFSGFATGNEEKQKSEVKARLGECVREKLFDFCDLLNIHVAKATKKANLILRIVDFLVSPHVTTDNEQKGKKRRSMTGKNSSPGEASVTPAKRRKQSSQSDEKKKPSPKVEEEVEDDDKDESADGHEDSQAKGKFSKKAEAEPTRDELHKEVVNMMKAGFKNSRFSDILDQLGEHFRVNLIYRKIEVKQVVREVMDSLYDEDKDDAVLADKLQSEPKKTKNAASREKAKREDTTEEISSYSSNFASSLHFVLKGKALQEGVNIPLDPVLHHKSGKLVSKEELKHKLMMIASKRK